MLVPVLQLGIVCKEHMQMRSLLARDSYHTANAKRDVSGLVIFRGVSKGTLGNVASVPSHQSVVMLC